MSTFMEKEILSQASMLEKTFMTNIDTIQKIAKVFQERKIRNIITAARGSSNNACTYFKYLVEVHAGITVSSAAPSVITIYNGKIDYTDTLVLGVSQSGKAADVMAILDTARKNGALTATVTNNPESPMATAADYHIFLNVGDEKSVAATKTMTSQMYVLGLLAAEISGNAALKSELQQVPKLANSVFSIKNDIFSSAKCLVSAEDCYVLGRGMNYASVQEAALKIQETTYVKARAYAVSDFHHGPFAVIDNRCNAILFAPKGTEQGDTTKDTLEMASKLKAAGCKLIVFSDNDEFKSTADSLVKMPSASDNISPFAYIIAIQFFALELSLLRGVNPDAPRGLNKVTITK